MGKPLVYPSVVRGRARANYDGLQTKNRPVDRVVHVLLEEGWTERIVTTLHSGEYIKWPLILRILKSQRAPASLITLGTLETVSAYGAFAVLRGMVGTLAQIGNVSGTTANNVAANLMIPVEVETNVHVKPFFTPDGKYRMTFEVGQVTQEV